MDFPGTFEPDVLLDDGDTITLGGTTLTAVATPGHTPGAMSFFFDVKDGNDAFRVGLHGGAGLNTLNRAFLDKYALPLTYRDDYISSMLRLNEERVDIFLGNHMQQNRTKQKYAEMQNGNPLAFVSPGEWNAFNLKCIENLKNLIRKEENEGNT